MDWRECVQTMASYIENHLNEDLSLKDIAAQVGYSPFYCSKAFRGKTGFCLKDYIRKRRLALAATELMKTKKRIIDIAFDSGYSSQEAFSRSFTEEFSLTPAVYRRRKGSLPLSSQPMLKTSTNMGVGREMDKKLMNHVKVTFISKPARKLLVWHQEGATDYHELCEIEGAEEIWRRLEKMEGTLGGVIAAWLNDKGKTRYVWGVEMPLDYSGPVPEGFESIEVPASEYVKFSHPDDEINHEKVTEAVWNVSELWKPEEHGCQWSDAEHPVYEDDREEEGYIVLKPIQRI